MPEPIQPVIENYQPLPEAARLLSKYGFYLSVSVFLYAILFPFRFDFSWQQLSTAWSHAGLIPYWSSKTGTRVTVDDLANILLTMPLGFAGFLHCTRRPGIWAVLRWCGLGLAVGLAAEFMQLAIPTRASVITDAINNGLGALIGAAAASVMGRHALEFFTGAAAERRNIYLWMLIWSLVVMLGPYDLSPDSISRSESGLLTGQTYLWESEKIVGSEWLRMAGFALIGALAVRLATPGRRKYTARQPLTAASLVFLFPAILQFARLLFQSHPFLLDDLALDTLGALAGALGSLFIPPTLQSFIGFLLFKVALIAAGLSPYSFSSWQRGMSFQWIPFCEFCKNRTPASLYEVILTFFSFAILGGLLQLSFSRCRRWHVVAYALAFSGAIEFAQTFLPSRTAGITNILVAGLGAWTGACVCAAVESARQNHSPSFS